MIHGKLKVMEVKRQAILGIAKEGGVGKYLSFPEHFGKRKKNIFTSVVDRIRQRASSWSSRFLSRTGKLTMFKAVLTSILTYTMLCFQVHVSLCKRIQRALTRFWWNPSNDKKCMCWVSWDKLTRPKTSGGLCLRDIQIFNQALLAKLAWRILTSPSCLLARVLKSKYCHKKNFLDVELPAVCSHGWRSMLYGRDLLKENLGKALDNGQDTRVWKRRLDKPWLQSQTMRSDKWSAPGSPSIRFTNRWSKMELEKNWRGAARIYLKKFVPKPEQRRSKRHLCVAAPTIRYLLDKIGIQLWSNQKKPPCIQNTINTTFQDQSFNWIKDVRASKVNFILLILLCYVQIENFRIAGYFIFLNKVLEKIIMFADIVCRFTSPFWLSNNIEGLVSFWFIFIYTLDNTFALSRVNLYENYLRHIVWKNKIYIIDRIFWPWKKINF